MYGRDPWHLQSMPEQVVLRSITNCLCHLYGKHRWGDGGLKKERETDEERDNDREVVCEPSAPRVMCSVLTA